MLMKQDGDTTDKKNWKIGERTFPVFKMDPAEKNLKGFYPHDTKQRTKRRKRVSCQ